MKFIADENVSTRLTAMLRGRGYDVVSISGTRKSTGDESILALGLREARIIVTQDKDFGELIFKLKQESYGIVLVQLWQLPRLARAERVLEVPGSHAEEMTGAITIIEPGRVRIRKFGSTADRS